MKRRAALGVLVALGAATATLCAFAQQPAKFARIGFLGVGTASGTAGRVDGLRAGLRELGYAEGKNLSIEFRWAEGNYERLPDLAAELLRLKVDVLVALGPPGTRAAKQATTTVPIVMVAGDVVAANLVASLARPGANVTGMTFFAQELSAKRLELLKDAMPRITQVAVLHNPGNPSSRPFLDAVRMTAESLNVELQPFAVRGPSEFKGAFAAMAKQRVGAVAVVEDAMLNVNPGAIADLAAGHRLALIGNRDLAEAGGLIGYGVNFFEIFHRAAYFVDKVLKGANPGDLPIERPTRFELVVNLRTAKTLGIRIPESVLQRADRVIE